MTATAIDYGVPTNRCGLQIRLGIEKGFFRDEDVDLTVRIVFGGPEIAAELDCGRLPMGELATPPGLAALARGARFKIVGSSVRRGAVQYLVAHPKIADWDGLRRARLGVLSCGSCSDWYMREVLTHHSIHPNNDVTIVALGPRYPKVLELLAAGKLDGAILSEPHVTIGEQTGLFRVWLGLNTLDYVPRLQWSIVVANDTMLATQPDVVAAALRACRRCYHYAADHRHDCTEFGAHYFEIPADITAKSISREFDDLHCDCEIDADGTEAAIALQDKLGAIIAVVNLPRLLTRGSRRLARPS